MVAFTWAGGDDKKTRAGRPGRLRNSSRDREKAPTVRLIAMLPPLSTTESPRRQTRT